MSTETLKRYGDFSPEVQGRDTRTWGVQLMIVKNGELFVRNDPDALDRREAHVLNEEEVVFAGLEPRLNSAGGGKKEAEGLSRAAQREMESELGIKGRGNLVIADDLPIVACGQIKEVDGVPKGALIGVILAAYEPTDEEWEELLLKDRVIEIEEALAQASKENDLEMRPTFRVALQIAQLYNQNDREGIERLVSGHNRLVVKAMGEYCTENDIDLKRGIFE